MRRIIATTLLVAAAFSPPQASAQELGPGDMVNLRPSARRQWGDAPTHPWTEATVVRLTTDTLWYRVGRDVAQLPVTDAEVRRATGRDHRWLTATVAGVAGATALGVVMYAAFEPEYAYRSIGAALACSINPSCQGAPQANSRAGDTALGAFVGAGLGIFLGYFVGKRLGRWEAVDLTPTFTDAGGPSLSIRVGL